MNRRGFFSLLVGASVAAMAPALARNPFRATKYTEGMTFHFWPAAHNTGPMTLQLDGGPVRQVRAVALGTVEHSSSRLALPYFEFQIRDGELVGVYEVAERNGWLHYSRLA
jgi:hypothetical protein